METDDNLDICRLCMTEDDVILFNIFSNTKISDSTVLKIRECIGLKVSDAVSIDIQYLLNVILTNSRGCS